MTGHAGRDERIKEVYLFPNGMVAVFDLQGQQMPQYQEPTYKARAALEAAFPRRLWHEWSQGWDGRCSCGLLPGEHPPTHGENTT